LLARFAESAGAHEADGGDEYHKDAHDNKSMPGAEAERARQFIEMCTRGRIERVRVGQRENEQIELLDYESEGNDGHAGAQPGKKRPLVGGMVGIVADHR